MAKAKNERIEVEGYHLDLRNYIVDSNAPWISIAVSLPDENLIVQTKIDDHNGVRNEQRLKRVGNLWFCPDSKTYVYYTPTHWR